MYYTYTWKDQLSKIEYYTNGSLNYYETLIYDASGNVTNINDSRTHYYNKSYLWDGRQLTQISAYCDTSYFKYNDQGIRTQKINNTCNGNVTTNFTLDGDKVLVETRSNGITLYFTYDRDGTLLSMNYNGAEYFYITNIQGDIIELVDINGNSVVKYKYDAWGNIIYQSGGALADINPYRYRGYRLDIETGLYYLQSRYYDPSIGRFISSDGLLGDTGNILTHNMYAYCANNPVMYSDITGYAPFWNNFSKVFAGSVIIGTLIVGTIVTGGALSVVLAGTAIGAISGAVGSTVSTAVNGDWENYGNNFLIGTAIGGISGAIAASPLGLGWQVGLNAALGSANYATTTAINGGNMTLGGLIFSSATGALAGLVGGAGFMKGNTIGNAASAFGAKNFFKVIGSNFGRAGLEIVVRNAINAFIVGGALNGGYAKLSHQVNPTGEFIGW